MAERKLIIGDLHDPQIAWDYREKRLVIITSDPKRCYFKNNSLVKKPVIPFIKSLKIDMSRRELGLDISNRLVRIQDSKISHIAFEKGKVVQNVNCFTLHSNGIVYLAVREKIFYILPEELNPELFYSYENDSIVPCSMLLSKDESMMFVSEGAIVFSVDVLNDATLGGRTRVLSVLEENIISMCSGKNNSIWCMSVTKATEVSEGGKILTVIPFETTVSYAIFAEHRIYTAEDDCVCYYRLEN